MESIVAGGAETRELKKRESERLVALEVDFWRQSCVRLDPARENTLIEIMKIKETVMEKRSEVKRKRRGVPQELSTRVFSVR